MTILSELFSHTECLTNKSVSYNLVCFRGQYCRWLVAHNFVQKFQWSITFQKRVPKNPVSNGINGFSNSFFLGSPNQSCLQSGKYQFVFILYEGTLRHLNLVTKKTHQTVSLCHCTYTSCLWKVDKSKDLIKLFQMQVTGSHVPPQLGQVQICLISYIKSQRITVPV